MHPQVSSSGFTPNGIQVLLHYHIVSTKHPRHDTSAVVQARLELQHFGLIQPMEEKGHQLVETALTPGHEVFTTTAVGKEVVERLCNVSPM